MKKINIIIDEKEVKSPAGLVQVDDLQNLAGCGKKQQLYLGRKGALDIPLFPNEYILVRKGVEFFLGDISQEKNPRLRREVKPKFNDSADIGFPQAKITGKDLKAKDGEFPNGRLFADIDGAVDAEIGDDMEIVLQDGDVYFVVPPIAVDDKGAIDIEECGKHGRHPPKSKHYRIRVDGEKYVVDGASITGEGILRLVGKDYESFSLNQKLRGGKRVPIEPNAEVDLTKPGVERFETVPKQSQQGGTSFELLPDDAEYLDANYPSKWEKLLSDNAYGLLIRDFPVPAGYTVNKADLMVLIPHAYPTAKLDMFFFAPELHKSNGASIPSVTAQQHFGKTWQRWSRHYDEQIGVIEHIEMVKNELNKEINT